MALSKSIAGTLLQLSKGDRIPASKLKGALVKELLEEGILVEQRVGRTKGLLYLPKPSDLDAFILNHFSIPSLEKYINALTQDNVTRADLVHVSGNSKIKKLRTFTGFLVNSYEPIKASLNNELLEIKPPIGTFQFIHQIRQFIPHPEVIIVGIENAENFSQVHKQRYLFENLHPLFVCRYPQNQNRDLINWLKSIPNPYLHFGDFDFAGIGIYLNEYKRHLGSRAAYFVPENIEMLISKYGNPMLYDNQKINFDEKLIDEKKILDLISLIHKYKKGLEQEILISVVPS